MRVSSATNPRSTARQGIAKQRPKRGYKNHRPGPPEAKLTLTNLAYNFGPLIFNKRKCPVG